MKHVHNLRPFRWFLLLSLGLMYIWGISFAEPGRESGQVFQQFTLFTSLMVVHIGLHWLCLTHQMERWKCSLPYFIGQGGLLLAISFVTSNWTVTLGLYLALIGEATAMLARTRHLVIIVGVLLTLFAFNTALLGILGRLRGVTDFTALLLFIVGYIILYTQQVQAREQTQGFLHQLEAAHVQLAAYATRVEELTLSAERQRMARELHDTLAQGVAGLIMQLEAANLHFAHQRFERAQEIVEGTMEGARETLVAARDAIDDLRLQTLQPDDLPLRVQEEINRFISVTSIPCQQDLAVLSTVPSAYCEHVLRVISEGLTNVTRHAHARYAWVCAYSRDGELAIEVGDDGVGFDLASLTWQDGHYGLLGLHERVRLIGGSLEITSASGVGTILQLRLPEKREEEKA